MPAGQALIDRGQVAVQLLDASTQLGQSHFCSLRHLALSDPLQPRANLRDALSSDDPKLSRMAPHSVHQLSALPDEQLAGAEIHRVGLHRGRLDGHEPHVRTRSRFANRCRVIPIVLTALDERLDVLWRDQPYRMAKPLE